MQIQTAVIWFHEQIEQYILTHGNLPFNVLSEIKKQAIKMEEQQIIKAAARGYLIGEDNLPLEDAKDFGLDYYISTHGSKGSDEIEKLEKPINLTFSQTEISDEEIEKAGWDYELNQIGDGYEHHFIEGAKWYREQLKKKQ